MFAAVLLLLAGCVNIIWGIAAIGNSNYFDENAQYVFSNVNTWGWVTLILGIVQVTAGISVANGGLYGRTIGILAAGVGAIAALGAVGGPNPFWALAVFALCVIVIHGLVVYGEDPGPGRN
jgi:hypothetical protein